MNFFPAQYSTLSSTALQAYLVDTYALSADINCRLLIRNVSDTYILENGKEQYIFKIYRDAHRKLNEIEGELELLNILKSKGHQVAYPIKDKKGNQIQHFDAIEGQRNGVLFSYAPGKVIHDLEQQHLMRFGQDLAAIHLTTEEIKIKYNRPTFNFETTLFQPLESLKLKVPELGDDLVYLEEITQKVIQKFKEFDTSKFSYGYCHYDLFPKNFHFDDEGNITFFDFDFAGEGYLINDLMSFLNHYFFHTLNNQITPDQAKIDFEYFLMSYQKTKSLSTQEIEAIPYLGIGFHIFFLKFFYDNYDDWSNIFLTPKYTKHRIGLIQKWVKMYCNF
jgi:Ser/Thr protein kinase RdoA (MazF antagonist)